MLFASAAHAVYPDKPVRMVVTAPPGGTIDSLARAIATGMSRELGQTVVIDNKGGASGLLGADAVAKSSPDGYTILLTDGAALAINAAVRKDMPFQMAKDLVSVSLVATTPSMLSAHPSFPASSVKELVAVAKKDPKAVSYAHPGVGTPHHLAGTMLAKSAGIELNHIPYKGGGPMVADVVGGQVPLLITGTLATMPHVKAGKLKALAIGSRQRSPLMPDVPTFIESGFPDFEAEVFFSLFVPANVPAEVAPALTRALGKALADADTRRKLEEQALVVVGSNAEQLRTHFQKESKKWGDLIRSANIVLE
jgi:tripartite-type tricarboxylate transporter receptor subunit TctC